jgi:hypothetical protein
MGYSLLSQFQGSLLGVSLGLFCQPLTAGSITAATHWPANDSLTAHPLSHHCLRLILSGVNHLIAQQGRIWEGRPQTGPTPQNFKPNNGQGQTSNPLPQQGSLAVIATLPLMLFFHENPCRLRQHLQQIAELWQPQELDTELETEVELFALSEAITFLLQPSPKLQQLIPQMLTQIPPETQLAQQLTQVSSFLQSGASLAAVSHCLMSASTLPQPLNAHLAIAIYCFLSTPTAFSLSVRRAMSIHPDSRLICGITAALSGAYNGLSSIPTPWKLKLRRQIQLDSVAPEASEPPIPIDQHILNQSTQLFQVWAGLYLPIDPDPNPLTSLIVAAPWSLPN